MTYVQAPDPRTQPLVKGPDFPALAGFRAEYQADGTDDTAIVDASGAMVETTTGALVAWDGETLIFPTGLALPSITLRQVARRASDRGIHTETRPITPELAAECPCGSSTRCTESARLANYTPPPVSSIHRTARIPPGGSTGGGAAFAGKRRAISSPAWLAALPLRHNPADRSAGFLRAGCSHHR